MTIEELLAVLFSGGLLGTMIAILGLFIWKFLQDIWWPIRIPVIRQRGENVIWILDERGRLAKRKDGYEVIKLKKDKANIKPPKYEQIQLTSKGKSVFPLFNTTGGQYFPIKAINSPSLDVVEDKSAKNWAILEHQRISEAYRPKEGFWQTYGMMVMSATFAAMVIFFVIYFSSTIQTASGNLAGASNQLAAAIEKAFGTATTTTPAPSAPIIIP